MNDVKPKITVEEIVSALDAYKSQADNSLAQLENNINQANAQINEWTKLKLMIVGQKQLIKDLYGKIVESPDKEQVNPAVKQ
jgi:hypothetical protein